MPEDLLELEADQLEDITPAEGAEPAAEPVAEGQEPTEPKADEPKTPVTSLFQSDGRKLDPQVSSVLSKLKSENPEVGKLLYKAVNRVAELDREFPGGLTEAKEIRNKLEELGGFEGIEEKLSGVEELNTLADQFMNADPAFVEDMATSSPEAFAALAPLVFRKFAETNAEGYGAYLGQVVYSDMQKNSIPLLMMRLGDVLGENPKAKEVFDQINAYLGGFKALSEKPLPEKKAATRETRQTTGDQREMDLRSREWKADRDSVQKDIVNGEYRKALAGRTPNTEEKAQILELFTTRAARLADSLFKDWQKKAQSYVSRNDKQGYLRYMRSIYARVTPEAMASAIKGTMKGAAVVNRQQTEKPRTMAAGATAGTPDPSFKPVSKEPNSYDIDWRQTSTQMLNQNRAVLKNGNKVSWR